MYIVTTGVRTQGDFCKKKGILRCYCFVRILKKKEAEFRICQGCFQATIYAILRQSKTTITQNAIVHKPAIVWTLVQFPYNFFFIIIIFMMQPCPTWQTEAKIGKLLHNLGYDAVLLTGLYINHQTHKHFFFFPLRRIKSLTLIHSTHFFFVFFFYRSNSQIGFCMNVVVENYLHDINIFCFTV